KRPQVLDRERINQHTVRFIGELDQAKGFTVAMETVRLGIHSTDPLPLVCDVGGKEAGKPFGAINQIRGHAITLPTTGSAREPPPETPPHDGRISGRINQFVPSTYFTRK